MSEKTERINNCSIDKKNLKLNCKVFEQLFNPLLIIKPIVTCFEVG